MPQSSIDDLINNARTQQGSPSPSSSNTDMDELINHARGGPPTPISRSKSKPAPQAPYTADSPEIIKDMGPLATLEQSRLQMRSNLINQGKGLGQQLLQPPLSARIAQEGIDYFRGEAHPLQDFTTFMGQKLDEAKGVAKGLIHSVTAPSEAYQSFKTGDMPGFVNNMTDTITQTLPLVGGVAEGIGADTLRTKPSIVRAAPTPPEAWLAGARTFSQPTVTDTLSRNFSSNWNMEKTPLLTSELKAAGGVVDTRTALEGIKERKEFQIGVKNKVLAPQQNTLVPGARAAEIQAKISAIPDNIHPGTPGYEAEVQRINNEAPPNEYTIGTLDQSLQGYRASEAIYHSKDVQARITAGETKLAIDHAGASTLRRLLYENATDSSVLRDANERIGALSEGQREFERLENQAAIESGRTGLQKSADVLSSLTSKRKAASDLATGSKFSTIDKDVASAVKRAQIIDQNTTTHEYGGFNSMPTMPEDFNSPQASHGQTRSFYNPTNAPAPSVVPGMNVQGLGTRTADYSSGRVLQGLDPNARSGGIQLPYGAPEPASTPLPQSPYGWSGVQGTAFRTRDLNGADVLNGLGSAPLNRSEHFKLEYGAPPPPPPSLGADASASQGELLSFEDTKKSTLPRPKKMVEPDFIPNRFGEDRPNPKAGQPIISDQTGKQMWTDGTTVWHDKPKAITPSLFPHDAAPAGIQDKPLNVSGIPEGSKLSYVSRDKLGSPTYHYVTPEGKTFQTSFEISTSKTNPPRQGLGANAVSFDTLLPPKPPNNIPRPPK